MQSSTDEYDKTIKAAIDEEDASWPFGWHESNPAFAKAYGDGGFFLSRCTAITGNVLGFGRLAS